MQTLVLKLENSLMRVNTLEGQRSKVKGELTQQSQQQGDGRSIDKQC